MMGWYGNGWMIVIMLGWLALVTLGVWALVALTRTRSIDAHHETARQILDRRLAIGEIDQEEYLQKRHILDTRASGSAVHVGGYPPV